MSGTKKQLQGLVNRALMAGTLFRNSTPVLSWFDPNNYKLFRELKLGVMEFEDPKQAVNYF